MLKRGRRRGGPGQKSEVQKETLDVKRGRAAICLDRFRSYWNRFGGKIKKIRVLHNRICTLKTLQI